LNTTNSSLQNIITDTYPLRDSINKIMWHPGLDHADSTALVKLGRIYARAQGDARSKPGALINRAYIRTVGLEALAYILVDIFHKDAAARRQPLTHHTANTMTQVFETIARLEAEEEANQAEEAERKKAEQAAKKAKKEAKKAKKEAKANANRRAV
jgi:hypothetical protein